MAPTKILKKLNDLLRLELQGMSRYLHHSFMVFGFSRKPIVAYFRGQAEESMAHAVMLGEKIVALGGHPEVSVETHWESERHTVREMLEINLKAEREAMKQYKALLAMIPKDDVALEEMIRAQIRTEQADIEELEKFLRDPEGV